MAEHPHAALVRKGYEAFSRGDMDTLRGLMTKDAALHVPGNSQLSGDFKGQDAIIDYWGRLFSLTDGTLKSELQHLLVDGRGHVVSVHRVTATRQGRSLDMIGGIVFRIVGDKATDFDECATDIDAFDEFFA
ncbi:nuclear transport factor 2 family protein [Streptomyces sp. NBC_00210]|uniref:nuclear transport factor 2 family protein n=1 Tax=unclassified Streptomyces TaxID=2593676 RepID=UPI0032558E40